MLLTWWGSTKVFHMVLEPFYTSLHPATVKATQYRACMNRNPADGTSTSNSQLRILQILTSSIGGQYCSFQKTKSLEKQHSSHPTCGVGGLWWYRHMSVEGCMLPWGNGRDLKARGSWGWMGGSGEHWKTGTTRLDTQWVMGSKRTVRRVSQPKSWGCRTRSGGEKLLLNQQTIL